VYFIIKTNEIKSVKFMEFIVYCGMGHFLSKPLLECLSKFAGVSVSSFLIENEQNVFLSESKLLSKGKFRGKELILPNSVFLVCKSFSDLL